MKRNLLALGSAAVLAVYTAGYERTKEAAARFADETEHRRRPPQPAPLPTAPTPTTMPAVAKAAPKKAAKKKQSAPVVVTQNAVTSVVTVDSAPVLKDTAPVPVA